MLTHPTFTFSKPVPAQTLNPVTPIRSVMKSSSIDLCLQFSPTNEFHSIDDLLVWFEIFELSPNGE